MLSPRAMLRPADRPHLRALGTGLQTVRKQLRIFRSTLAASRSSQSPSAASQPRAAQQPASPFGPLASKAMVKLQVQVGFGNCVRKGAVHELEIEALPTDSVRQCKEKIAAAVGGAVSADALVLTFGPNDRKLGVQYVGDPSVDETKLLLSQFSMLQWVERFPHWKLTAGLLPAAPLPPGVAIQKAAATAEQKDPDQAVADARAKGAIPKISDLPAPWGPKPYTPPPEQDLVNSGYLPPRYPDASSPLNDVDVGAA